VATQSHQRAKDRAAGFVTDFPDTLDGLVPILHQQETLRIVTNAGGLNPRSCAVECGKLLNRAGLGEIEIGIVTGDDVLKESPFSRLTVPSGATPFPGKKDKEGRKTKKGAGDE